MTVTSYERYERKRYSRNTKILFHYHSLYKSAFYVDESRSSHQSNFVPILPANIFSENTYLLTFSRERLNQYGTRDKIFRECTCPEHPLHYHGEIIYDTESTRTDDAGHEGFARVNSFNLLFLFFPSRARNRDRRGFTDACTSISGTYDRLSFVIPARRFFRLILWSDET